MIIDVSQHLTGEHLIFDKKHESDVCDVCMLFDNRKSTITTITTITAITAITSITTMTTLQFGIQCTLRFQMTFKYNSSHITHFISCTYCTFHIMHHISYIISHCKSHHITTYHITSNNHHIASHHIGLHHIALHCIASRSRCRHALAY
jgi:hypothetical protein